MQPVVGRIQDIADALCLSKGTVSRVLNGRGEIAQQTRSRVLEVAQQLNYAPRRRRTRQRNTVPSLDRVAFVCGNRCVDENGVPDPSYVGFHVLTHLEQAASEQSVGLMVSFIDAKNPDLRLEHLRVLRTNDIDAAILVYPFPEAIVERLASVMPVVSLEVIYPNAAVDVIGPSHALDAMRAVEYLHSLGHRRIAYVGDELSTGHRLTQGLRHAGFVSGLARCGLQYRAEDVVNVVGTPMIDRPSLPGVIARFVAGGVTAVITSIDRHGYFLWNELPNIGVSVPRDVSIVGIGGIPRATGQSQLTTFRCDFHGMALAALEVARSRRAGNDHSQLYQEIQSQFVTGGSAGAPRVV